MAALNVNLKLLPLLGRSVEVERFVLVRPVFNLRIDKEGRANWSFDRLAASQGTSGLAAAAERAGAHPFSGFLVTPAQARTAPLPNLTLGEVRVVDGTVHFADQRSGQYQNRIPTPTQGYRSQVGRGRFNPKSLVTAGMGGTVPYGGGRGAAAGAGRYGGARPR